MMTFAIRFCTFHGLLATVLTVLIDFIFIGLSNIATGLCDNFD